jgi:hypothetical protein|tara:strand:- start:129 stop:392 length:264 start_codon:yes stop_codon:yes gene_type:complete
LSSHFSPTLSLWYTRVQRERERIIPRNKLCEKQKGVKLYAILGKNPALFDSIFFFSSFEKKTEKSERFGTEESERVKEAERHDREGG